MEKNKKDNTSNKKISISKEQKIAFQSFLVILITLLITLSVHHFVPSYNWHWIIFTWIAILSPVIVVNFKVNAEKRLTLTKEQIKTGNGIFLQLILWYWFIDITYMVIFMHLTIWIYVLGIIILIKIFYDLTMTFLNRKIKNSMYNLTIIINFIIGVFLTIYLIFIIENDDLRNIVTAMITSIYGGLLTLVGVAWTIKHANNEKKIEEVKKNKPFVFIVNPMNVTTDSSKTTVEIDEKDVIKPNFKEGKKYHLNDFIIENVDYSYSSIKGFCFNNKLIEMNIAQAFRKNEQYDVIINFDFLFNEEIKEVSLLLQDMLDNYYLLKTNAILHMQDKKNYIEIKSGIEIVKAKVDFESLLIEEIN